MLPQLLQNFASVSLLVEHAAQIEKPGEGDDTRGWGPPFVKNADGTDGDAAYFQSTNRGRTLRADKLRSIA